MSEIDLMSFCDPNVSRFDLSAPFVKDGWRYATDSRIVVRVYAHDEPDTVPPDRKRPFPNTASLFPVEFPPCEFAIDESNYDPAEHGDWFLCECKSSKFEECPECRGSGFFICEHCDHERDCRACMGTGDKNCRSRGCKICNAALPLLCYRVGESHIARGMVGLIRNLPSVRLGKPFPGADSETVPFAFDGGQGLVATLSPETVRRELANS